VRPLIARKRPSATEEQEHLLPTVQEAVCGNKRRHLYTYAPRRSKETQMPNPVAHFEIYADNPERLAGFYRELFGWEKAQATGAVVLRPKSAVPRMGWFAVLADPEMNVFALWQDDPGAA